MDCSPITHIENQDNGNMLVTFQDGTNIVIPPGFQIDCIDGNWNLVPILRNRPGSDDS